MVEQLKTKKVNRRGITRKNSCNSPNYLVLLQGLPAVHENRVFVLVTGSTCQFFGVIATSKAIGISA